MGSALIAGGWRLLRVESDLSSTLRPGHWLSYAGIALPVLTATATVATLLAGPQREALETLHTYRRYPLAGPLGQAWPEPGPALLVGAGEALASVLFLAERLRAPPGLVLLEGDPPPFRPVPSQFVVAGPPAHVIAAAPMLEARGIPSRIASPSGMPGCLEGEVAELLDLTRGYYAHAPVYAGACAAVLARLTTPVAFASAPPV